VLREELSPRRADVIEIDRGVLAKDYSLAISRE